MDRQTQKQTGGKTGRLEDKTGSQKKKGKENKDSGEEQGARNGDRLRQMEKTE